MSLTADFGRALLREIYPDVRKAIPSVRLRDAWVYNLGRDHWEFHYEGFYWHGGASDAFDARAKGWSAYLRKIGAPGYEL